VRVEKVESESGPKKISLPLAYPAERWPALRSIGLPCGALACPAEHWPARPAFFCPARRWAGKRQWAGKHFRKGCLRGGVLPRL
jgi:hypothetical protein